VTTSNPGSSTVSITTVRLVRITTDVDHDACETDDFTMEDIQQHASIPSDSREYELADGTLTFEDSGINQDACKGAPLELTLKAI
jgi:hypothetical protein